MLVFIFSLTAPQSIPGYTSQHGAMNTSQASALTFKRLQEIPRYIQNEKRTFPNVSRKVCFGSNRTVSLHKQEVFMRRGREEGVGVGRRGGWRGWAGGIRRLG